jgi:hypothetical protein
MSDKAWERLGFAAMATITFVCTLAVIRWAIDFVAWSGIDSGWAQAIGSVVAIAVAFWIAHRDTRKRERDTLDMASLAAASIELSLYHLVGAVDLAIAKFSLYESHSSPPLFQEIGHDLAEVVLIPEDCLLRLVGLKNSCASQIALAQDRIISTRTLIQKVQNEPNAPEIWVQHAAIHANILRNASQLLTSARMKITAQIAKIEAI